MEKIVKGGIVIFKKQTPRKSNKMKENCAYYEALQYPIIRRSNWTLKSCLIVK